MVWVNEFAPVVSGVSKLELGAPPGTSLSGHSITGYRESSGKLDPLDNPALTPPGGTFTTSEGVWGGYPVQWYTQPRAVALAGPDGLIEFLDFGTTTVANPTSGTAAGVTPTKVTATSTGASFARVGTGSAASAFTWEKQTATIGLSNAGQTITAAAPDPGPDPGPTGQAADVAAFLGRPGDPDTIAQATVQLPFVTAAVEAYTRGREFYYGGAGPSLELVIISATARLVNNPTLDTSEGIGDYRVQPGSFAGWSLPELAVLNRYRKRAQ